MLRLLTFFLLLTSLAFGDVFSEVSEETGVPRELLIAIAKTESNLHPYAFAVYSKTLLPFLERSCRSRRFVKRKYLYTGCYLKSRKEAERFLEKLLSSPSVVSFSVGLMQVNSSWIKTLDLSPYSLLDVKTNVFLGALIFKFYLELEGDYVKALSRYYGKRGGVALKYVRRVVRNLE